MQWSSGQSSVSSVLSPRDAPAPAPAPAPPSQQLNITRVMSTAIRACASCASSKTKCDGSRPCSRCVRLGKDQDCCDRDRKGHYRQMQKREREMQLQQQLQQKMQTQMPHSQQQQQAAYLPGRMERFNGDQQMTSKQNLSSTPQQVSNPIFEIVNNVLPIDHLSRASSSFEGLPESPKSSLGGGANLIHMNKQMWGPSGMIRNSSNSTLEEQAANNLWEQQSLPERQLTPNALMQFDLPINPPQSHAASPKLQPNAPAMYSPLAGSIPLRMEGVPAHASSPFFPGTELGPGSKTNLPIPLPSATPLLPMSSLRMVQPLFRGYDMDAFRSAATTLFAASMDTNQTRALPPAAYSGDFEYHRSSLDVLRSQFNVDRVLPMVQTGTIPCEFVELFLTSMSEVVGQEDLVAVAAAVPVRLFLSVDSDYAFEAQRIPRAVQSSLTTQRAQRARQCPRGGFASIKQRNSADIELAMSVALAEATRRSQEVGYLKPTTPLARASEASFPNKPFLLQPFPVYYNFECSPSWPQSDASGKLVLAPARRERFPEDESEVAQMVMEYSDPRFSVWPRNESADRSHRRCSCHRKHSSSSSSRRRERSAVKRTKKQLLRKVLGALDNSSQQQQHQSEGQQQTANFKSQIAAVAQVFFEDDSDESRNDDSQGSSDSSRSRSPPSSSHRRHHRHRDRSCDHSRSRSRSRSDSRERSRTRSRSRSRSRSRKQSSRSRKHNRHHRRSGSESPSRQQDASSSINCACGVSYQHQCVPGPVRQLHASNCTVPAEGLTRTSSFPSFYSSIAAEAVAIATPTTASSAESESTTTATATAPTSPFACRCPMIIDAPVTLRVNRAWERLYGYSESEFLERICRLSCKQALADLFTKSYEQWIPLMLFSVLNDPHHSSARVVDMVHRSGAVQKAVFTTSLVCGTQGYKYVSSWSID